MLFKTVDRCREPGCNCEDTGGIVLYFGPDREEAEYEKRQARYPDPEIWEIKDDASDINTVHPPSVQPVDYACCHGSYDQCSVCDSYADSPNPPRHGETLEEYQQRII